MPDFSRMLEQAQAMQSRLQQIAENFGRSA